MEPNLIKSLIESNPKEISQLYNAYKEAFLSFGKKYSLGYDDLVDIYQEAFIALRKHAINGKLDAVKSSLKTYLFGICKFKIYDLLKERKKTTSLDSSILTKDDTFELIDTEIVDETLTLEQQLLRTFFKKLGKKCQDMLTLFYARGLTIEEIIECTEYKSSSVVRSHKSRCLKTLKDMIKLRK